MLYSLPSTQKIEGIWHSADYQVWRDAMDRIDPNAFGRIHDELDSRFDGSEIETAGWIPGSDWSGSVFQPIYNACAGDQVAAGRFFGLLVQQVVMDRMDCWSFGKFEKNGNPISSTVYFRIDCP